MTYLSDRDVAIVLRALRYGLENINVYIKSFTVLCGSQKGRVVIDGVDFTDTYKRDFRNFSALRDKLEKRRRA